MAWALKGALAALAVGIGIAWFGCWLSKSVHCTQAQYPPNSVRCSLYGDEDVKDRETTIFTYPLEVDGHVSRILQGGEWWEPDSNYRHVCEFYRAQNVSEHAMSFLDVGANIGAFAVPLASCFSKMNAQRPGKIIAVEANPGNVALLNASINANDASNVIVVPKALGNASGGVLKLWMDPANAAHTSAVTGIEHGREKDIGWESWQSMSVPIITLDDLYLEMPVLMSKVLMMKMDIEGSEGHALRGAERFFSEAPPCHCTIELIPTFLDKAGTPMWTVLRYLESKGYRQTDVRSYDFVFEQRDLAKCYESKLRMLSAPES